MTKDRLIQIENANKSLPQEDIEEGWHFCPSWNGALISPNSVESRYCDCDG